jgi:hypothetical protein
LAGCITPRYASDGGLIKAGFLRDFSCALAGTPRREDLRISQTRRFSPCGFRQSFRRPLAAPNVLDNTGYVGVRDHLTHDSLFESVVEIAFIRAKAILDVRQQRVF